MKKIILILALLITVNVFGQDVTTTMGWSTNSFRDTLTATIDSIKVNGVGGGVIYTITAYTTTGTDTINVYSTPSGYTVWAQKSLTDYVTGDLVTQIVATTTPKEYVVSDPNMVSMLLVTPDGSASCVVIVSKKSGNLSLGTGAYSMNQSLDNIEADADSTVDMTTANATSLAIIDDWDESDRAKVNPIVGQAGVAGNRGTASATTQRVTIANDDTTSTLQTAIKTAVELLDNSVDGNYLNTNMNVAGTDVAANRGTANAQTLRTTIANNDSTVTLLTAVKTALEIIDNFISGSRGLVTEDNSASIKTAVELIDNAISGSEMQVDVVASLPAGTAIVGKFGIDQTTPGTTNKVDIGTNGTVTANAGTNLNTSALALETGGNLATIAGKDFATQTTLALIKAKTDNIDNATSTLATTANQTNGTQQTKLTDGTNVVDVEAGAVKKGLYVRLTDGTNVSSLSATGDLEVSGDGGVALATSANQTTHNAKLDSIDASSTRNEAFLNSIKINSAPATKYYGLKDTVTTRTDTTTFAGTWVEGEIKATDSCEVAINGSFTAGETFIITETTAVKLPKWAIATSSKLFVRRYGGAGTVTFYLRMSAY